MGRHVLQEQGYRDLIRQHACEWRVLSGSLPGCAVGDLVELESADDAYAFSKPDGGSVATLPVATTEEEVDASGCVSLRNAAAGVSVTLAPSDKLITAWMASSAPHG